MELRLLSSRELFSWPQVWSVLLEPSFSKKGLFLPVWCACSSGQVFSQGCSWPPPFLAWLSSPPLCGCFSPLFLPPFFSGRPEFLPALVCALFFSAQAWLWRVLLIWRMGRFFLPPPCWVWSAFSWCVVLEKISRRESGNRGAAHAAHRRRPGPRPCLALRHEAAATACMRRCVERPHE